jgi:transposase
MPAPIPVALRKRIIAAWEADGDTWEELAARFQVGVATVNRLIALYRATQSVEPRPHGGGHAFELGDEHLEILKEEVEARPDITLEELATVLIEKGGPSVSTSTIGRAVRERLKLTRKKSPPSRPNASVRRSSHGASSSSTSSRASPPRSSSSSTRRARTSP